MSKTGDSVNENQMIKLTNKCLYSSVLIIRRNLEVSNMCYPPKSRMTNYQGDRNILRGFHDHATMYFTGVYGNFSVTSTKFVFLEFEVFSLLLFTLQSINLLLGNSMDSIIQKSYFSEANTLIQLQDI